MKNLVFFFFLDSFFVVFVVFVFVFIIGRKNKGKHLFGLQELTREAVFPTGQKQPEQGPFKKKKKNEKKIRIFFSSYFM